MQHAATPRAVAVAVQARHGRTARAPMWRRPRPTPPLPLPLPLQGIENKKTFELTEEEINKLREEVGKYTTEADLVGGPHQREGSASLGLRAPLRSA